MSAADKNIEDVPVDEEVEDVKVEDLRNPDVVTKYRLAADIANNALKAVLAKIAAGASIVELCKLGDSLMLEGTDKIYKSKKGKKDARENSKGIAFPTSLSVNHIVGSFSPLESEDATIQAGDVVKVELGCHIHGYAALVAHTIVVPGGADAEGDKITGRKADVLKAVTLGAQAAIRLLKPGNKNTQVTAVFKKIADAFGVKGLVGVRSHQLERYVLEAEKQVDMAFDDQAKGDYKTPECEFQTNEVYAIDVIMSTGAGRTTLDEARTTIYKRDVNMNYQLKMKNSRFILHQVDEKFPYYCFNIRELDQKKVKFGIVECKNHGVVTDYPVLREKEGDIVAHIKFTAMLLPNGTTKITGLPLDASKYQSDKKLEDKEIIDLLNTAVNKNKKKKKKNKKKNKKKAAAAAADN